MNKHAAWLLLLPMVAWANELPPAKVVAKPSKAVESPAPEVKAAKPAEAQQAAPSAKAPSKHAAPQQMAEPIKIGKPAAPATAPAPAPMSSAPAPEVLKPIETPTVRYVSPQFSTAKAEAHRPVVRSKAPSASARAKNTKSTTSYAMKPGLVRVLPAAQLPSGAILPPQFQWSASAKNMSNVKGAWGAMEQEVPKDLDLVKALPEVVATPVPGRKIASPKYYSETNQELRWQYYSYP